MIISKNLFILIVVIQLGLAAGLFLNYQTEEVEAQVCAPIWQSGQMCGLYWKSQNSVQINVFCQGSNVKNNCPTGYSHQDFGYIETGSGEREFKTCFKI